MPIMPGIFEMALIAHTPESVTDWHRRFVELFEALYETGFSLDYQHRVTPSVRYLPVGKAIEAQPMALPSDKLEVVFDQFEVFGIGQCQCRTAAAVLGRGCGKPLGNCTVMGQWAQRGIDDGSLRQVARKEALEIKREAEAHGMVNWMMNIQRAKSQCSCSCCGCCCHALRMVNEFNAPGLIAPPHFLPRWEAAKCIACGKCAKRCPMGAIIVDTNRTPHTPRAGAAGGMPTLVVGLEDRVAAASCPRPAGGQYPADGTRSMPATFRHLRERCVGCGQCVLACDARRALTMEPVRPYRTPFRNWPSLLAHAAPGFLLTSWNVWRQRRS
jgi:ferredoxin